MSITEKQSLLLKTDWKTLVVLDACRYDVFMECVSQTALAGSLLRADSGAADTEAWYRKHWAGDHSDTILVGGNPIPWHRNLVDVFAKAVKCWKGTRLGTPVEILERAVQEDGKMVVHVVTPHLPFVGEVGKAFHADLEGSGQGDVSCYQAVTNWGKANDWERLRELYSESLLSVLAEVEYLSGLFVPPIVLTADHGEMIGESDTYGHPRSGLEVTRFVPWFTLSTDEEVITDRLADLGYIEDTGPVIVEVPEQKETRPHILRIMARQSIQAAGWGDRRVPERMLQAWIEEYEAS